MYIPDFDNLSSFFFLGQSSYRLVNFIGLFREQTFDFIDFFLCFPFSIILIFLHAFIISFLLFALGLVGFHLKQSEKSILFSFSHIGVYSFKVPFKYFYVYCLMF